MAMFVTYTEGAGLSSSQNGRHVPQLSIYTTKRMQRCQGRIPNTPILSFRSHSVSSSYDDYYSTHQRQNQR